MFYDQIITLYFSNTILLSQKGVIHSTKSYEDYSLNMDVNYEYEDDYHGSQHSLYDSLSSVSSIYDYINKLLDDPKKLGDVNEEAHNDFTENNETVAIILHISYGIILLIGVVVLTYTIRSMSASFRFFFACKIRSVISLIVISLN